MEKICSYKLNDEECLVSFDVFLFTKVPVNLALEVAEQSLCNDSTLNDNKIEFKQYNISIKTALGSDQYNSLRTILPSNVRHCYGISGLGDCCKHGHGNKLRKKLSQLSLILPNFGLDVLVDTSAIILKNHF